MDPLDELERMALNVTQDSEIDDTINAEEISLWMKLFSYTRPEAEDLLEKHNQDYTRARISDEHWDMIRSELEPQGYSRTAYEHELATGGRRKIPSTIPTKVSLQEARKSYLLKLEGPLHTAEIIRTITAVVDLPETVIGDSDDGKTTFCCVNGAMKQLITHWLSTNSPTFSPVFARLTQKANKSFSSTCLHPTLGIESTLPQHRPTHVSDIAQFQPAQCQYPVWYFFYGTLGQPDILSRQVGVAEHDIVLRPARLYRGEVKTWGGKYRALVDGADDAIVEGYAYQVMSMEQEDGLRTYETDNYEVVRCLMSIAFDGGRREEIKGCTFRFVGEVDKKT